MKWLNDMPPEYLRAEHSYSINMMAVRMFRNQYNEAVRQYHAQTLRAVRTLCLIVRSAAQRMLSIAGLSTACVVPGFDIVAEAFMLCGVLDDDAWKTILYASVSDAAAVLLMEARNLWII